MSITTKKGDKGETSLIGCRTKKSDTRIEAYGTVDELNAAIGVALAYVENSNIKNTLSHVQNDLFTLGAELAAAGTETSNIPKVTNDHLEPLEKALAGTEKTLPKQKAFILPKGTKSAAHLHLARTICRRAERRAVECNEKYALNPPIIQYLNRLSDLLFLFARKENKEEEKEVTYSKD